MEWEIQDEFSAGVDGHFKMKLKRKSINWLFAGGILAIIAGAIIFHGLLLRKMGGYLIVEDPLKPAQAIVLLAGHFPYRAMEGAELFRSGWAPRVVLIQGRENGEQRETRKLGLSFPQTWRMNRQVLMRMGVPAGSIRILQRGASGTLHDLLAVRRHLPADGRPVIIVTSKAHTRRARLIWNSLAGDRSPGIVRAARKDAFDPRRWWRVRKFALSVVREYLGIINFWSGFLVSE